MNTLYIVLFAFGVFLYGDVDAQRGKEAPRRPPPPPFLRTVSADGKREYYNILKKKDETIAAQKLEILQWAETYGVEDQVKAFEANLTKNKEELQGKVTELVNKLPDLYRELLSIYNNDDQTAAERKAALDKAKSENEKEWNVIMFATSLFRAKRSGSPGPGQRRPGKRNLGFFNNERLN